jgi:hypothetical protein
MVVVPGHQPWWQGPLSRNEFSLSRSSAVLCVAYVGNFAPYHAMSATEPPMWERVKSQFPGTGVARNAKDSWCNVLSKLGYGRLIQEPARRCTERPPFPVTHYH